MLSNVVACILAGGEGRRLFPLTAHRAKPAMRFAGIYRLIDIPLSNCINSDIHKMLVFSQYKALSLYRHLRLGWSFLHEELDEYIIGLPPRPSARYRGTADAVYQHLALLERIDPDYVLILAGDHVYHMDYRALLSFHREHRAEVTVSTFLVPRQQASLFGILTVDQLGEVTSFLEKPTEASGLPTKGSLVLASMGIYIFTFTALREVLLEDAQFPTSHDFGRDILPRMLGRYRTMAFPFTEGIDKEPAYWRDVGTIDAYWEAHMDLVGPNPAFQVSRSRWPMRTAPLHEPPTMFLTPPDVPSRKALVTNSLIAPGCVVEGGRVDRAILSPGVWIEPEAEVEEVILLDGVHIGRGAKVHRAILERATVVPCGMRIGYDPSADGDRFTVSDGGITVVGHSPTVHPHPQPELV